MVHNADGSNVDSEGCKMEGPTEGPISKKLIADGGSISVEHFLSNDSLLLSLSLFRISSYALN